MNNMATSQLKTNAEPSTNGELTLTLCTFCNNSTNGFEKRLFATAQPKGPFFPVLAELQGKKTKLDDLGRAVVCVACFHHLLRQWSSFERRGIPVRKREYNIITGMPRFHMIIHVQNGSIETSRVTVERVSSPDHSTNCTIYWISLIATGYFCLCSLTETRSIEYC